MTRRRTYAPASVGIIGIGIVLAAISGCANNDPGQAADETITLHGNGKEMTLESNPADPSYKATYPLGKYTSMTIHVRSTGLLQTSCTTASGPIACNADPFFVQAEKTNHNTRIVKVYDIYKKLVFNKELPLSEASTNKSASNSEIGTSAAADTTGYGSYGGSTTPSYCSPILDPTVNGTMISVGSTMCEQLDSNCISAAEASCASAASASGDGAYGSSSGTGYGDDSEYGSGTGDTAASYSTGGTGYGSGSSYEVSQPVAIPSGSTMTAGAADACVASNVEAVREQFCANIDYQLQADNISDQINCSIVSATYSPATNETLTAPNIGATELPNVQEHCWDIIQQAWDTVTTSLGACDASLYSQWEDTARAELRVEGACMASPIVLDLDGDGIHVGSVKDGILFDLFGTGKAVTSAWPSSGDALLALDRNANGEIDGAQELFGNATSGKSYADGFAALAELDENGDGVISSRDAAYHSMVVWRDLNSDGVSQPNELMSLHDAGVRSLNLNATRTEGPSSFDKNGNQIPLVSGFTRVDGSSGEMADAFFRFRPIK